MKAPKIILLGWNSEPKFIFIVTYFLSTTPKKKESCQPHLNVHPLGIFSL